MPTQKDVANRAGVSIATVSRFLNKNGYVGQEACRRITEAIRELGYRPNLIARSLKMHRSGTIGCIFPDIENPFFIGFIKEIEKVFRSNGYNVVLCNTENDQEQEHAAIEMLLSRQIEGYLCILCEENPRKSLELLIDEKVLFIDRKPKDTDRPSVTLDNRFGVYLAVRHLVELGHTKIAIVNVPQHTFTGRERMAGFDEAQRDCGLDPRPEYRLIASFSAESAFEATLKLFSLPSPPTALLPMSGLTTVGVLKALRTAGLRVPHQVSVIGFDDFMYADLFDPPLTTVVQPVDRFAITASDMLLAMLTEAFPWGSGEGGTRILKPFLKIRDSCAPPYSR